MRRKDREVTDIKEIRQVLDTCKVCRIGMADKDGIYIVPVNYGYVWEDGKPVLYIHGAGEGRKAEILKNDPEVAVEMDCGHELVNAEKACGHSYRFSSIMGSGRVSRIEDPDGKRRALALIMEHQTGRTFTMEDVPEKVLSQTAVTRIDVEEYSCKRHC